MSEEGIPKRGDRCPVCGLPIDWVERRVVNGHVYYYAYHYFKDENGQKRRKKCYLGAKVYDYVSRKNIDLGTTFRGMAIDPAQRLTEYFNSALEKLSAKIESGALEPEEARSWLSLLKDMNSRLERLIALLEDYVKELSKAQAGPSEERAQAQASEALKELDKELKEVLRELKASQGA